MSGKKVRRDHGPSLPHFGPVCQSLQAWLAFSERLARFLGNHERSQRRPEGYHGRHDDYLEDLRGQQAVDMLTEREILREVRAHLEEVVAD